MVALNIGNKISLITYVLILPLIQESAFVNKLVCCNFKGTMEGRSVLENLTIQTDDLNTQE